MKNLLIVTIDGYAGSGKSSVASELSKKARFVHLNSGLLYRALSLRVSAAGLAYDQKAEILNILAETKFDFILDKGDFRTRITVNGEEIPDEILLSDEIGRGASAVGIIKEVREELTQVQKNFARQYSEESFSGLVKRGIVLEGRDAGTVVFPDADFKFFLNASVEERARRRLKEESARGNSLSLEELVALIRERDHRDSSREFGALKVADSAMVIDTEGKSMQEVVDLIFNRISE